MFGSNNTFGVYDLPKLGSMLTTSGLLKAECCNIYKHFNKQLATKVILIQCFKTAYPSEVTGKDQMNDYGYFHLGPIESIFI